MFDAATCRRLYSRLRCPCDLFLGFACLAAFRGIALGHVAGQSTNVVLQEFVLALELVVV